MSFEDPTARLIAALLTVAGAFIVAWVTHQLTISRERMRQLEADRSGRTDRIENFMNDVHAPIIRWTSEVTGLIDHVLTDIWNPDSDVEWKKIKDEHFRELLVSLRAIDKGLENILDTVTPYLPLLDKKIADTLATEIPVISRNLKLMETLEKEKSDKPAQALKRLEALKPTLAALKSQFDVDLYTKFIDSVAR
jgi:hypothetical protein